MDKKYKGIAEEILKLTGVKINGSNAQDIQIHNDEFYIRAITEGELGIGESYMYCWWDTEKVNELINEILKAQLDEKIRRKKSILIKLFTARLFNMQSKKRTCIIGEKHYDRGNDLFKNMLDKRMNYSCTYCKDANSLDEAQENKLELICRKLYLKPLMRILDIGFGWAAFGKYAAKKSNIEVI